MSWIKEVGWNRDSIQDNNFIAIFRQDFYTESGKSYMNLGEDSVTRRVSEYERKGLKRKITSINPDWEDEYLKLRGKTFGEAVYHAAENEVDGSSSIVLWPFEEIQRDNVNASTTAYHVIELLEELEDSDQDKRYWQAAWNSIENL